MIFDNSQVTCIGKSVVWNDFLVKLHITGSTFLISGQYLHLPKRVHTGACVFLISCVTGGYWMVALVKYSLTFGSHVEIS